jgi:hypothetical protein
MAQNTWLHVDPSKSRLSWSALSFSQVVIRSRAQFSMHARPLLLFSSIRIDPHRERLIDRSIQQHNRKTCKTRLQFHDIIEARYPAPLLRPPLPHLRGEFHTHRSSCQPAHPTRCLTEAQLLGGEGHPCRRSRSPRWRTAGWGGSIVPSVKRQNQNDERTQTTRHSMGT